MRTVLSRKFYAGSPKLWERNLIAKSLRVKLGEERLAGRIVEVEVYLGLATKPRMPSAAKRYGMPYSSVHPALPTSILSMACYYCLNVSCMPNGQAGGVLIRALEPSHGLQTMARLRGLPDISKPRLCLPQAQDASVSVGYYSCHA